MVYIKNAANPPCPTCSQQMDIVERIILGHCQACNIDSLTSTMIDNHFDGSDAVRMLESISQGRSLRMARADDMTFPE